jgi:hypothetical protein
MSYTMYPSHAKPRVFATKPSAASRDASSLDPSSAGVTPGERREKRTPTRSVDRFLVSRLVSLEGVPEY